MHGLFDALPNDMWQLERNRHYCTIAFSESNIIYFLKFFLESSNFRALWRSRLTYQRAYSVTSQ